MANRWVELVMDLGRPHTAARLAEGVAAFGSEHGGWHVVVRDVRDPNLVTAMRANEGDGVIAAVPRRQLQEMRRLGKPLVNMVDACGIRWTSTVVFENEVVGMFGARALMDAGFRRFAFVGLDSEDSRTRERGFAKGLAAKGHFYESAGARGRGRSGGAVRKWGWMELFEGSCLTRWLKGVSVPLGVMTFNDPMATMVVDACQRLGLRVPEDVAVLGVDNDELICLYAAVRLSSVDLDEYRLGYEAARELNRLMDGGDPTPRLVKVAPKGVVLRRSTDVLAVADAVVRTGLARIRREACEGLTVETLMADSGLSRKTLDRRFQDSIGRTVSDEIRRVKLSQAKSLLEETTISMVDIAMQCGFSSQQQLCRAVRDGLGKRPGELRRAARG